MCIRDSATKGPSSCECYAAPTYACTTSSAYVATRGCTTAPVYTAVNVHATCSTPAKKSFATRQPRRA
eukprot:6785426-Pyramimonas_sp.AAC.1